jgi:hypothetical protein
VSVRLPEDLIQRLDRFLDWSATSRRVKGSRNAAVRAALCTWLDDQEQLAGFVHSDVLYQQFRTTYTRLCQGHDWVLISRVRQQLQWPPERFDAVLEALRANRHVELERAAPGPMNAQDVHDSYHVHGHLYSRFRWCD